MFFNHNFNSILRKKSNQQVKCGKEQAIPQQSKRHGTVTLAGRNEKLQMRMQ